MFEKSLQDLVKGIRAANNDSAAFIAKAIQEIKEELASPDVPIKAQALQKLTYVSRAAQPSPTTRDLRQWFLGLAPQRYEPQPRDCVTRTA
jgi:hypothetical protein